jgi:cytochrome c556
MRLLSIVGCVLLLGSCSKRAREADPGPVAPPPAVEPQPAAEAPIRSAGETKPHMAEHFIQVAVLRDAVVAGDYDATRAPARWLAEHGAPANVPDEWIEQVTNLKVVASGARDATDLAGVSAAVGELGHACASCHERLGAKVELVTPPEAPVSGDVANHMQRHQWAADRMWDGLFAPSDDAWKRGAAAFYDAPLHRADLDDGHPRMSLAKRAHLIGKLAMTETDPLGRARAYGELVATCAGCHAAKP